jgi:predicted peptidase
MKKLWAITFIFFYFGAFAQDFSLFQKKEFIDSKGKVLPYRILYPEHYDKAKKYPLILFLHGAGERGNDNEKQLIHGGSLFIADSSRKKFPCIVVFPQCPTDSSWTAVKIDRSKTPLSFQFDYSAPETWPLTATFELVRKIVNEESVDKSRLYITGLSMGGMGTFEAEFRYSNMFAVAMPICGGGDTTHYDKRVANTSFWIFHGEADAVVNVEESRAMVRKLQALHIDVKYSEYPGVNHNSWDNAFAEPTFLSWMFAHKREHAKL